MAGTKVGDLHAELGLDDKLNPELKKAKTKADSTVKDMDADVKLGLDPTGLDKGIRQAEGRMDSAGSNLGGILMAGMAGVVAGGGALIVGELGKAMERESSNAKLGVQLGLSPEMAKAAGEVTGEIYGQAFGESLGEVNDALRYVGQNMGGFGDKSKEEVEDITKGVLTLADVFEQDLGKTTAAAGTLMKTGLAKDGMEALDLITRGLQSPANKADDLLDTFIEYSTQFRKLGITGPQAIGLLSQGLAGGARDADIVADAFKEFSIRAIDGSKLTQDSFTALGLNASETAAKIAAGGPVAAEGLQMTLDKLLAIEDPVQRNIIGVGLFGTQWEDMGAAVNGLDLSAAAGQIGSIEGATTRATDAMSTNQAKVEEWRRGFETNVTDFTANSVIPWFDTMGQRLEDMGNQWDTGRGLVGDFHGGLMTLGDGFIWLKNEAIDPTVGALQTLFGWAGDTIEKVEDLWEKLTGGTTEGGGALGFAVGGPVGGVLGLLAGSFDTGGVVPGPKGSAQLALVHGGETILPTHKASGWDMGAGNPGDQQYTTFSDGSSALMELGGDGRWFNRSAREADNAALRYITAMQQQSQKSTGTGLNRPIEVRVMLGKRELGRAVVEADRSIR